MYLAGSIPLNVDLVYFLEHNLAFSVKIYSQTVVNTELILAKG